MICEYSLGLSRAKELEFELLNTSSGYKKVFPEYVSIETLDIECLDELCDYVNEEIK